MRENVTHAVTVDDEHDLVGCYEPKAEKVEEVVEASSDDTPDAPALKIKKKKLHQITRKVVAFSKMISTDSPPLLIVGR